MRSLRVVAIDDDEMDLALVRRAAKAVGEIEVDLVAFSDPEEGFAHLAEHDVDALLLDFEMGSCTALEFLGRLECPCFPVIVLTGHDSIDLAVESVLGGASDFLCKSALSPESLQRSLSNAVEKAQLRREVQRYREQLEARNEELTARNEEIGRFCHHVSHELKTPLTAAMEFVSLLRDGLAGELSEQQAEYLAIVGDSCSMMVRQLNDLLDLTRIETKKLSLRPESVDLAEIAQRVAETMEPMVAAASLELRLQLCAPPCVASVDPSRIQQILFNLVGNAIKFTDAGGTITIELEAAGDSGWSLAVRDTGRGIAAEHQPRIFDRLYQVKDDDRSVGGLGIGLNLCREIARLHDGDIGVESEPGVGSCFTLTLPARLAGCEPTSGEPIAQMA